MAENSSIIVQEPPKNLEYMNKLFKYDQQKTLLQKAKTFITKTDRTRPHSISEWCQILGSTKNNSSTRTFLEELVEKDALVEKGSKGNPPNECKLYILDKKRLEKVFYNDPYWSWIKDISFRVINGPEENKKIVTDF
jgi:hypothetical protein